MSSLTNVEILRKLNTFRPRPYQSVVLKAFEKGFRRIIAVMPRRAGKDVLALNLMIRQMYLKPGNYAYIFPSYQQGKKILWEGIDSDGNRLLNYFPRCIVKRKHQQEMKVSIVTRDGRESIFQIIGSDNCDSLVGTNYRGMVFSEYALQDPRGYQFLSPILRAIPDSWALFISTPRGKNHFYELYELGLKSPDWFVCHFSLRDTQHIPAEEVAREKSEGIMSEDLIQQEYYTSFTQGIEGSYFAKDIDKLYMEDRIGYVPYEPSQKVHTAWDLGVDDDTAIIFFQTIGSMLRIIDCYSKRRVGIEHYAAVLKGKPYEYGKHFAPNDINVHEWGSGVPRIKKARELGISFSVCDRHEKIDGIENCRSKFPHLWIDKTHCKDLIKALQNYRQEFDYKNQIYKKLPLHDWSSHYADAFRYMCWCASKCSSRMSVEYLDEIYNKSLSHAANDSSLPPQLQVHPSSRLYR